MPIKEIITEHGEKLPTPHDADGGINPETRDRIISKLTPIAAIYTLEYLGFDEKQASEALLSAANRIAGDILHTGYQVSRSDDPDYLDMIDAILSESGVFIQCYTPGAGHIPKPDKMRLTIEKAANWAWNKYGGMG